MAPLNLKRRTLFMAITVSKLILSLTSALGVVETARADVRSEVENASKSYDAAIRAGDLKALDALFDDEGDFIEADGKTYDKQGYLPHFVDGRTWETTASTETKLRVMSDTVVIETGLFTGTGQFQGQPFRLELRYMDVWHKKGGRWTIAAETSTPVAK
jgi:ketosteroid isomerase-like protein